VAVKYSGGKENKGTILELDFDIAGRGADIQFLSQYPEEKEWLWPPCTSLTCSSGSVRYDGAKTIVNVLAAVTQKGPDVSRIVKCTDRPTSFQQQQQWPIPKDNLNLTSAIGDSIADATRTAKLLEKLCNLAANNAENKERIAAIGGIDCVVQAMAAHIGVAGVQEQGCGAMFNLATNTKNKERIAAAGGINRVVHAMAAHVGVAGVQEQGCVALCNLAANNAENQERIAAAGGIDWVVQAMAAHVGVAGVQEQGCAALCNLAGNNAENQERIAAAGGIDRVVQAMAAHVGVAGVQEQGCDALWSLAGNNAENQGRIAAAGGIDRLVQAKKNHQSCATNADGALRALGASN
jgi:predicted hotdog family 3-hydroxylacyl-ACP dehydratase